jgi:TRAP-type mannitol/chloroaromatic compound transport system permease small subunit
VDMHLLRSISVKIDGLNLAVGKAVSWGTLGMVVVTFTDVVMRYAFNTSFVFTQELEWHLFAFVFLMGAGYTLYVEGHVRVEVFYGKLSRRSKAWINIFGVLVFLIPSCAIFIKSGIPFVQSSIGVMEGSPDPGGIPCRFILKACIPAGYALLLLQGLSLFLKSTFILRGVNPDAEMEK